MDVASDRVNRVHVSRLRLLKDMQERSALRELSMKEAQRHMATLAVENASQELAIVQHHCARTQAALYQELMSLDTLTSAALDHHHLQIERLAAKLTSSHQVVDDARIAEEKAEAAASEKRAVWVKRSTAKHKWQQIEDDVRRAFDTHSEAASEMEADDEASVRHGRVSLAEAPRTDKPRAL
ncbi:hypothetical protein [Mesorhizobium neociceri]|uniref:Uncharacterized protein n=1 Tax=Mesorhizobium neociceri TaxID=1307853 RepID=A0A838B9S4_9HYPH|nr:hypothetical protein [Mesorhizobium neociceri]MBA1142424.1 hypothetical protein [Mesorhizobium neociceri]